MKISRNDLCPCGSGKKFKKCCLASAGKQPMVQTAHRFRFEAGSYGGADKGFMPAVICYRRLDDGQWEDHFCLVNPTRSFGTEKTAAGAADVDLMQAQAAKTQSQSDTAFAASLREKGYLNVQGFRRAQDLPPA